jgi:hypothetical protein
MYYFVNPRSAGVSDPAARSQIAAKRIWRPDDLRLHSVHFAHGEPSGRCAATLCGHAISILITFHLAHHGHRVRDWQNCPGSAIRSQSHIQVAVRDVGCLRFRKGGS